MSDRDGPGSPVQSVDPFDLPEWLGIAEVTWASSAGGLGEARLRGSLSPGEALDGAGVPCDLLAVDVAHPVVVASEELRRAAHLAWHHGEVALVSIEHRLTLAVPGTGFTADRVIEAISRLARAVGARPTSYAVWLRIGG